MWCVFRKWRLNKWLNLNLKKENSSLVTFEIADQNNLFLNIFCVNCTPRMSRECNHCNGRLNSSGKKDLSDKFESQTLCLSKESTISKLTLSCNGRDPFNTNIWSRL